MSEIPEMPTQTSSEIPTSVGGGESFPTDSVGDIEEVGAHISDETDVPEEEATTDYVEVATNENKEQREGPSEDKVKGVSESLEGKATKEAEGETNNLNTASNKHLRDQMKQPEALDAEKSPEGKKALTKITEIDEKIREELENLKEFFEQINGNKKPEGTSNQSSTQPEMSQDTVNPESEAIEGERVDEINESSEESGNEPDEQEETSSETTDTSEDVIDGEWILIDEGLDPETEDYLRENGAEDLTGQLTPEELRLYESFRQLILDRFPPVGSVSSVGTLNSMLDSLPDEEGSKLKQVIKILLRTAVRAETRTVAFIADEIVKSADKDDKTTKFIFGSIRDAAKGAESMADTAITGKEKAERLTKTTRDFIFGKKKRS